MVRSQITHMKYPEILDKLDERELELFEKDLKDGYVHKYIDRRKEFFAMKDKICAVCQGPVYDDCYVLIFGEPSIRKKAHFCGADCLAYFVEKKLKTATQKRNK